VPARVGAAAAALEAACARIGRDPARIERSMLVFTRIAESPDPAPFLAEFRRLNPWFRFVPDGEALGALVVGHPGHCLRRIASISRELCVTRPTLDLSGLPAGDTRRVLAALSPNDNLVDTHTSAA